MICQLLKKDEQSSLSVIDLIDYAGLIQCQHQADDTLRAARQLIPTTIYNIVSKELQKLERSKQFDAADAVFHEFDAVDGIFSTTQPFSPWNDFGLPKGEADTKKYFQDEKTHWLKLLDELLKKPSIQRFQAKNILKETIEKARAAVAELEFHNMERMQPKVEVPKRKDTESNVDVEHMARVDTRINLQAEIENESQNTFLSIFAWNHQDIFNLGKGLYQKPFNSYWQDEYPWGSEEEVQRKKCPVFAFSHLVASEDNLAPSRAALTRFAPIFDNTNIFVTNNQVRVISMFEHEDKTVKLFSPSQKLFQHVLVRETSDSKNPLEFYLIDQNEMTTFETALKEEKEKNIENQAKAWMTPPLIATMV